MDEATLTNGEKNVALRNRYHINQAELAREVGVGRQSIVDYEKDRLTPENLNAAIMRLADKKKPAKSGKRIPAEAVAV